MNQSISCPVFVPVHGGAFGVHISVRHISKSLENAKKQPKKAHSQCEGLEFDSP